METLDQNILLLINGWHNTFFDCVMSMISGKLIWVPLYVCILFELIRRYKLSAQMFLALAVVGLTFFLTDFCCSQLIRPMFMRLRPVCEENPVHTLVHAVEGYRSNSYGFPSCHASNTFGLATFVWLTFKDRRTTAIIFLWAIIMSYSRVYLGVHYPGDVIVGAIIGIICGFCVAKIGIFIRKKWLKDDDITVKTPYLIDLSCMLTYLVIFIISVKKIFM